MAVKASWMRAVVIPTGGSSRARMRAGEESCHSLSHTLRQWMAYDAGICWDVLNVSAQELSFSVMFKRKLFSKLCCYAQSAMFYPLFCITYHFYYSHSLFKHQIYFMHFIGFLNAVPPNGWIRNSVRQVGSCF